MMLSSVSRFPFAAGTFFLSDLVTSIFDFFFFLCNFFVLKPSSPSLLFSSAVLFKLVVSLLLESSGDQRSVSASVRYG
jgi:hypothetical protein